VGVALPEEPDFDRRERAPNTERLTEERSGVVEIPKDKIVEFLKERGDHDKAAAAERDLPDKVDHEEHSNLVEQHGIDPKELLGKVGL
jgi:hypothetical protein